jgi:hypothetical protein
MLVGWANIITNGVAADIKKEVNMGILTILGDFLLGVGVVLLGVAALYYVLISKEVRDE